MDRPEVELNTTEKSSGLPDVVNLAGKFAAFSDQWAPRIVAQMNDYHLKVVRVQGEFTWHSHADTDEVFLVLDGHLTIDTPAGELSLRPGELVVIPRGMSHRPRAAAECRVLLIEPAGTRNTGDAGGDLTAPDDVWV